MSQMGRQSRGGTAGTRDMARNLLMSVLLLAFMPVFPSTVAVVRLPDGTPVPRQASTLHRFGEFDDWRSGPVRPSNLTR
jgi:hypothetical protein